MRLPPAIIFINADINDVTIGTLTAQFHLNETVDFDEYNARIAADSNYPNIVRMNKFRILVVLPTFRDFTNRETADIVIFYNQGQATVEKNKFGPPGLSLPILRINIFDLLRDVGSKWVPILPPSIEQRPRRLGGIFAMQGEDQSGVHDPNPDNMYNNKDFINRK